MLDPMGSLKKWQAGAAEVSAVLKTVGNENRLLILCQLAAREELAVSTLVSAVGLSQSAVSQHLALMRAEGVVQGRRDGKTVYYSIADSRIRAMMVALYQIYCAERE